MAARPVASTTIWVSPGAWRCSGRSPARCASCGRAKPATHPTDRPTDAALRLPGSGDASGLAFQTSINLADFAPGHGVGFVYGQAGGGWLLSPDFGNNQELLELRYQWKLSATQSIETRVRQRRDLEQRTDAARKRVDDDVYVRFTQRF